MGTPLRLARVAALRLVSTVLLLAAVHAVVAAPARAERVMDDRTEAPSLVVGDGPDARALPLREVRYEVEVSGVAASVHLVQTFEGPASGAPVDARYVFPLSSRAAVHAMVMRVGDREIDGVVKPKAVAKQEFDAAQDAGLTASLLEQQRPNVFTMSLANIRPGDIVEVAVDYLEILASADGVYRVDLPGAVAERYDGGASPGASIFEGIAAAPILAAATQAATDEVPATGPLPGVVREIAVHVDPALPVQWIGSPTHRVEVTADPDEGGVDLSLVDPELDPRRDFTVELALASDELGTGVLRYDAPPTLGVPAERFFLAQIEPPARVAPAVIPPRDLVVVLDTSGSMEGFPIDTAKALVRSLAHALRPEDRIDVVAFAGSSEVFAPSGGVAATPAALTRLDDFIDGLGAGGGTELLPALETAFALPIAPHAARSIAVVTDGGITLEKAALDLVRARASGTTVFAFGIGHGVNRYLVDGLARAGHGEAFICDSVERASGVAEDFADALAAPALTRLSVRFEGVDAYDVEPAVLPDVYLGRPVTIVGKYREARPDARVIVSGETGAGPWSGAAPFGAVSPHAAGLRTLWARERVATLDDAGGLRVGAEAEVERLGVGYQIMTSQTSFVAVDSAGHDAVAERSRPDAGSALVIGQGLSGTGVGGGGGLGGGGLAAFGGSGGAFDAGFSGNGASGSPAPAPQNVTRVRLGAVKGAVTEAWRALIASFVRRRLGSLSVCAQRFAPAGASPFVGRAELKVTVSAAGVPLKLEWPRHPHLGADLQKCIERYIRPFKLPPPTPAGNAVAVLVLVFGP